MGSFKNILSKIELGDKSDNEKQKEKSMVGIYKIFIFNK